LGGREERNALFVAEGGLMKAVILAGGVGARLAEKTEETPKPMIPIGGFPLLWHIMKLYGRHGINDFIVCLGHKGHVIKDYFLNYRSHAADLRIDLRDGSVQTLCSSFEPWTVTLVDTGRDTMTGGRLKRVVPLLGDETFCFTYGDGLSDIDISAEIAFHRAHGKLATVAAVRHPGRFGILETQGAAVTGFREKPSEEFGWISGGFFVLEPGVAGYIAGDGTAWEREPLRALSREDQLEAFTHHGFWHACDTLGDLRALRKLWEDDPKWKVWA
jgi:glucose-1-phosphate cytidylyltransferase